MPIAISKGLIKKLPADERTGIEEFLWAKSGGHCFLCEEKLNRAADRIEAEILDAAQTAGG